MAIHFLCPLGHPLVVPDERAGKKGRCPVCQQRVYVPQVGSAPPKSTSPPPTASSSPPRLPTQPGPIASELDNILAQELGLDFEELAPPPQTTPTAPAPSAPTARSTTPPQVTPAPAANDSPFAPQGADFSQAEVPPPGKKPPTMRDLSSPHRPVRDPVPPQLAVPNPAPPPVSFKELPRSGDGETMSWQLAAIESELQAATTAPAMASSPPPLKLSQPPTDDYFSTRNQVPPPRASGPPTVAAVSAPPPLQPTTATAPPAMSPPPGPAVPPSLHSTLPPLLTPAIPATLVSTPAPSIPWRSPPTSDYHLGPPTANTAANHLANSLGGTTIPPQRVFAADQKMPWSIEPHDSETQHELVVNEGWPQTTYMIVAAMLAVTGLGFVPLITRLNGGLMPQWATIVVGLTVAELSAALWLATLPDWRLLNLVGIFTGLIAACYASGLAIVVTNAAAGTLPLDLFDVRNYAGGWCTGNALCWGMISYALVRTSRQWKRNLRRLLRPV